MKIAIAGKGGSAKTTIAGILAQSPAQEGPRGLAGEADINPSGSPWGLAPDAPYEPVAARQALDEEPETAVHATTIEELIERLRRRASRWRLPGPRIQDRPPDPGGA